MTIKNLAVPIVEATINGIDISEEFISLEWRAFVNNGYIVRAKLSNTFHYILDQLGVFTLYSSEARAKELILKFRIGWKGGRDDIEIIPKSDIITAIITDLDAYGTPDMGQFEFIAIDPPSFYLNAGKGDGRVYEGNITNVIKQVVSEFSNGQVTAHVTETNDSKTGLWPMMRQDPKTFILSLLDWSADLTPNKTHWLITAKNNDIYIQEQQELKNRKKHLGTFNVEFGNPKPNDIRDYSLIANNFLSIYQTKMFTQGISTVSGKFIDKKTDKDKAEIKDENTGKKLNVKFDKGFRRPSKELGTSIVAHPEFSAGDVGIKYADYIGGRPRQLYLKMLQTILRARIGFDGSPKFKDPSILGVSTLTLNWRDLQNQKTMMNGKWIVYGFHHQVTFAGENIQPDWKTDAYIYRLDKNANADKI